MEHKWILSHVFNEIDTDKDGRITRDQLNEALNKNTLVSEKINTSHMSFKEFLKILDDLNREIRRETI